MKHSRTLALAVVLAGAAALAACTANPVADMMLPSSAFESTVATDTPQVTPSSATTQADTTNRGGVGSIGGT